MYHSQKPYVFKTVYFLLSLPVLGWCGYLLIQYIARGFHSGASFDDIIDMITLLVAILFEGAIMGFILRSYRNPTILMKNLVFKADGTPFRPGLIMVSVGTVLFGGALGVLVYSTAAGGILEALPLQVRCFLIGLVWIAFHNLLFTLLYFPVFRHEAGTFETI